MIQEEKTIDYKRLLSLPAVILLGIAYYVFISVTHVRIPCFFHAVTGLYCPGCGSTSMFYLLAHGDVTGAFHQNMALFITAPLLAYLIGWMYLSYAGVVSNQKITRVNGYIAWTLVILFIVFGVLRNIF